MAKTFIVYDNVGGIESPKVIYAENAREARSKYIAQTFPRERPGRKPWITVLRDTKRNRQNLGLIDKQEQKPSPVRTRQIATLKADFDSKRTE